MDNAMEQLLAVYKAQNEELKVELRTAREHERIALLALSDAQSAIGAARGCLEMIADVIEQGNDLSEDGIKRVLITIHHQVVKIDKWLGLIGTVTEAKE